MTKKIIFFKKKKYHESQIAGAFADKLYNISYTQIPKKSQQFGHYLVRFCRISAAKSAGEGTTAGGGGEILRKWKIPITIFFFTVYYGYYGYYGTFLQGFNDSEPRHQKKLRNPKI